MNILSKLAASVVFLTGCAAVPTTAQPAPPITVASVDHKFVSWVGMVQAYMYAGR